MGIDQNIQWYVNAALKSNLNALKIARVIPQPIHSILKNSLKRQGILRSPNTIKITM